MTGRRTLARKAPRQTRAKATVESLLKATAQVLRRDGYDRASTNRIAARAGVNIASLYQYFPNKESLVSALIDQQLEGLASWMLPALIEAARLPLRRAAELIVRKLLAGYMEDVSLARVLLMQVPRLERVNPMVELDRKLVEQVRARLAERRDAKIKDPSLAAFAVVHTIDALAQAAVVERPELLTDPRYAQLITEATMCLLHRG